MKFWGLTSQDFSGDCGKIPKCVDPVKNGAGSEEIGKESPRLLLPFLKIS
jgi:hypothetical protein